MLVESYRVLSVSDFNGGGPRKNFNFVMAIGPDDTEIGGNLKAEFLHALNIGLGIAASGFSFAYEVADGEFTEDLYPASASLIATNLGFGDTIITPAEFFLRFNSELRQYICTLADHVTYPPDEITMETHDMGPYTFRTPKASPSGDIQVTYIDDIKGTAEVFHLIWQSMASKLLALIKTNAFNYLNAISFPLGFAEVDEEGRMLEGTRRIYPQVFPTKVEVSSAESSGQDFTKVTVTYSRLPSIMGLSVIAPAISALKLPDYKEKPKPEKPKPPEETWDWETAFKESDPAGHAEWSRNYTSRDWRKNSLLGRKIYGDYGSLSNFELFTESSHWTQAKLPITAGY